MNRKSIILRILPFALFVLLTSLQGQWDESSRYWVYCLKTVVVAGLIAYLWPKLKEMRPVFSWEALLAGIVVFLIWIGLDGFYPKTGELWAKLSGTPLKPPASWNPFSFYEDNLLLAWGVVFTRIAGAACLVPLVEEVFYRSFLYRFLIQEKFEKVPLHQFSLLPFLGVSLLFGLVHHEWLAGFLCGLVYQGLVCYKGRLGDAITAHGVTNLLLGIWVIWKGAWNFW